MSAKRKNEKTIFKAALELKTPEERIAYVNEVCADEPALRERILALLEANEDKGDFLETLLDDSAVTLGNQELKEKPGTVIGRYKLLEKIGEGGMAVVYIAEQERPIRRKVALKIIKLGMDTKSVIARFEVERQALAMMDHPNIAKVFDAGATETGRPYFVMELVQGTSITAYCDENRLSIKERLGLFIQICNAVQHAHQKGIIHRDLKPSNVLIMVQDGEPTPKVIDFGIAKATKQRLTERTLFTRYAQMIGTPAYMSPEQAELSDLEIDIRTDIYSLGILLYELLTGTTPFSEEQLRQAGYLEMQRIICQEEPTKPSTKLTALGEKLTDIAEHHGSTPDALSRAVQGDLDWIVMKSIEKNRSRRYETVEGFADDIQRHINDEPVLARPPELMYRLKKYLRRHRLQVAAVLIITLLGVAVIFSLSIWKQYRDQLEVSESITHKQTLARANKFFSERDLHAALKNAESILNSRYVGPEARLLYARILIESQRSKDAVFILENLLDEKPEVAGDARDFLKKIYLDVELSDEDRLRIAQKVPGKTIYVDANATGTNDGTSWANAYNYLQDALMAAINGDEIKVAVGIYKPDQGAKVTLGDREATFQLKPSVAVYGGIGGESILSGDLNGDDGPDFANNNENSYHVLNGSQTNKRTILDGFTITAGNANGKKTLSQNKLLSSGGGMYIKKGSPTIMNCTFSGNAAYFEGGGIYYSSHSNLTITDCIFTGNSAKNGGGMKIGRNSNPVITRCVFSKNIADKGGGIFNIFNDGSKFINCVFSGNSASDDGGGMCNQTCTPILRDCIFRGNTAKVAGAMNNDVKSNPKIINCTFTGNSAQRDAGGMNNQNSSPMLTNCVFSRNSAGDDGGGMNNGGGIPTIKNCTFKENRAGTGGAMSNNKMSHPILTCCIFSGNSADNGGGGVAFHVSEPNITNCTFSMNSAAKGGAVAYWDNSSCKLNNCILWGNIAPSGPQLSLQENSSVTIKYCNLQDGLPGIYTDQNSSVMWGIGNIDSDPLFVDATNDDYHLQAYSPCIDSGDNSAIPPSVTMDLNENPRIINGIVDMGAYEYNNPLSPSLRARNPSPNNGATDVMQRSTLEWSAGDNAQQHDVYIGIDEKAVRSAIMQSPEYKGTKKLGSESYKSVDLENGKTYYWRIDEHNTDVTISKGRVWSFTIANEPLEHTTQNRKEVMPDKEK